MRIVFGSTAQKGRRSSMIWSKSSMLNTFFFRAYLYHSLKPGGGCLPYFLRYFFTVCLKVVDLLVAYSRHFWSASFIKAAIGCESTTSGDVVGVGTSCTTEVCVGCSLAGVFCGRSGIGM